MADWIELMKKLGECVDCLGFDIRPIQSDPVANAYGAG